jgi:hypothetical protein
LPCPDRHHGTAYRALAGAILLAACVNTETGAGSDFFACAEDRGTPALDAVVLVNGLAAEAPACTGIALAPNLVLTKLSCVLSSSSPAFNCDEEAGWRPIETGDFASWLEAPDPALTTVSSARLDGTGDLAGDVEAGVAEILSSRGASRCSDDIALLVLTASLRLPQPAIRLSNDHAPNEAVVIRGRSAPSRDNPVGTISAITGSRGDDVLPPRAFAVSVGTCSADRGGAVFSRDTGALVGVVQWATEDCGGQTIALQLGPFRHLLREAAEAADAILIAEKPAGAQGHVAGISCGD